MLYDHHGLQIREIQSLVGLESTRESNCYIEIFPLPKDLKSKFNSRFSSVLCSSSDVLLGSQAGPIATW